jgi:hypothetical protein
MNNRSRTLIATLGACVAFGAHAVPVTFSASGGNVAGIQTTVDAFRSTLGNLNANVAGSFGSGRREINWDGVPDNFAAPNNLPANFFNVNSPRGVVFSTPGTGFQVSANAVNPTATPIEFGNLDPSLPGQFAAFSAQRLFTALGSNITDVSFFVPGSATAATVSAFGAVFTDVDLANLTSIQFFDPFDVSLGTFNVPVSGAGVVANEGFSFLGVAFTTERIGRVRITSGQGPLGNAGIDVVAMDDFIYAEPIAAVPEPETYSLLLGGLAWLGLMARRARRGAPRA